MSELVTVASPGRDVVEVDGRSGRRYRANDGMYRMSRRDAADLVSIGGFKPGIGGVIRAAGHPCPVCGFRSVFKECSRCRDAGLIEHSNESE